MLAADILSRQFSGMLCIAGLARFLRPSELYAKMEPENTKMKLLFLLSVSYVIFLLPGELHFLHKLFSVCFFGYNILVRY
jgi:hypothetical protein